MASKTDLAYDAIMQAIAEKVPTANTPQLERLALAFRYARGGAQPGSPSTDSK